MDSLWHIAYLHPPYSVGLPALKITSKLLGVGLPSYQALLEGALTERLTFNVPRKKTDTTLRELTTAAEKHLAGILLGESRFVNASKVP